MIRKFFIVVLLVIFSGCGTTKTALKNTADNLIKEISRTASGGVSAEANAIKVDTPAVKIKMPENKVVEKTVTTTKEYTNGNGNPVKETTVEVTKEETKSNNYTWLIVRLLVGLFIAYWIFNKIKSEED